MEMLMNQPLFGTYIKALRIGYGNAESMKCFMRLSDDFDNFYVELVPYDRPNSLTKLNKPHRVWWNDQSIIQESPVLSMIKFIKQPMAFILNDKGCLIQSPNAD